MTDELPPLRIVVSVYLLGIGVISGRENVVNNSQLVVLLFMLSYCDS